MITDSLSTDSIQTTVWTQRNEGRYAGIRLVGKVAFSDKAKRAGKYERAKQQTRKFDTKFHSWKSVMGMIGEVVGKKET